jgi:hypothetical protein
LATGFIGHLQNITTNNYGSLTELHTLKITVTTAHIKSYLVFSSRCLVAVSNGGRSPSSGFPNCPRPQLPASHFSQLQLSTDSIVTQSQNRSYFTTGGLPPISSSWHQAPWESRPENFFQLNPWGNSAYATSSLTRRWVLPLMYMLGLSNKSSVCPDFAEQIMPILLILCYNGTLVTWTVVSLVTAMFKPLIFSMAVLALSYAANMFIYHVFVWLLIVAVTILFYNRIQREGWKPCANRGPVRILERFQWCREPGSVGSAILRGRCLALIPMRDKRKSLLIWSVPYGGLV